MSQGYPERMALELRLETQPIPITARQYDELPHELRRRVEVVGGYVLVSPSPTPFHQRVSGNLFYSLRQQRPADVECLTTVDVRLADSPLCIRVPDILLVTTRRSVRSAMRPEHVTLAIEIVSPSTAWIDRFHKPVEYANAGIPHYWRVEEEPDDTVALHVFRQGQYDSAGTYRAGIARLDEPFPVEIDVPGLTRVG